MSETMVFSNILDCIYEVYVYPASNSIKVFELERLGKQIENRFRGKKREVIPKIEYLINELNKGR